MSTIWTKPNTFNVKHTQGDTFDKTATVTTPATWAGYTSGKCEVRDENGVLAFSLTVDISVAGKLRLYNATVITNAVKFYCFDIQWTMTDGRIKTWTDENGGLYIFEITRQATT
jgi:uncharacterized membrane protein